MQYTANFPKHCNKEGAASSSGNVFQSPVDVRWDHNNKYTPLTQIMIFGKIRLCQKGGEFFFFFFKERTQYSPLLQPAERNSCCLNDMI